MRRLSRMDWAVIAIIAVFTVLRLALAALIGLGVDESYTVSVAHHLHLSYFDHPPLQYWITHLFMPLLGDGRAARLPFIALFAASSWLLYRLTQVLFDERAGLAAVLALSSSAYFSFGAGEFVLPDGPLLLAELAAALVLARALFPRRASPGSSADPPPRAALGPWLCAGLWVGVAGLSKYHAVLFAAGLTLYLLSVPQRRRLLAGPAPWAGLVVALLLMTPVIIWNVQHEWVSVVYQGGRARAQGGGVHPALVLANVLGQAIWVLPWIFVPLVLGAWRALRAGPGAERGWYCLCLALPTIVLFTAVPAWGALGLPHWQMPGWLMLYPVLGDYAARCLAGARLRRWAIACAVLVVAVAGGVTWEAATGEGRLLAPALFARGDPTLEALEWGALAEELRARGLLRPGMFVITTSWIDAGKIAQALHDRVPVLVFGADPKEFAFRVDPRLLLGHDAVLIERVPAAGVIEQRLRPYFGSLEQQAPFAFGRAGLPEIRLQLFLARDLEVPLPEPAWR
jgi:4-amino-4-deoxy-L-arabinose transferase-like glycosyltransferase